MCEVRTTNPTQVGSILRKHWVEVNVEISVEKNGELRCKLKHHQQKSLMKSHKANAAV